MLVSALSIRILLHGCASLKEKRSVVKSVKERLRNKFNLSVAEVGALDHHSFAEIGIAVVGSENRFNEEILQKAVGFMENDFRFEIVSIERVI